MRKSLLLPILTLLVASCTDGAIVEPEATLARGGVTATQPIVVMSRNLYLGADIDLLLDPTANLNQVLAGALAQIQQTNFPVRAAAIAQEIHDVQPHLIGLQEVTSYAVTLEDGTVVSALGFPLDFLDVLQADLTALGDDYVVAHRTPNVSLTFPLGGIDASLEGLYVTYQDGDAILARADVDIANATGGHFPTQQYLLVGGTVFENERGYAMVDATVNGQDIRFASAHLEIQTFEDVQEQQARELANILADSPLPVILVGDFNSAANHDAPAGSQTDSYHILRNAGYTDLWLRQPHSVGGLTCCQLADLSNTTSMLNQRLDIAFVRWGKAGFGGQSQMQIVGNSPSDIITIVPNVYTLWPSDHAGIAAWLWPAPGRVAMR
jgi:endonuclease/exonuclease/phosphatase family metal-dependent hydrolase